VANGDWRLVFYRSTPTLRPRIPVGLSFEEPLGIADVTF